MNTTAYRHVVVVGALALLLACGDDETGSGGGGTGGAGTGGTGGDPTPAESCTKPGDHGNAIGVGEYCTPSGSECSGFPEAALCLASVGQDQWFCSRLCAASSECGAGATCYVDKDGSACVPKHCLSDGSGGSGGIAGGGGTGGVGGGSGGGGAG